MRKYFCPECHCTVFEEVQVDVTVSVPIEQCNGDFDYGDLNDTENYGGYIDRIQCKNCGYVIKTKEGYPVMDMEELKKALEDVGAYEDN